MGKAATTPPTDEDVRQAEDVIARHREATTKARQNAMAPILDILQSVGFAKAMESLEGLNDQSVKSHYQALKTGADQLVRIGERDAQT